MTTEDAADAVRHFQPDDVRHFQPKAPGGIPVVQLAAGRGLRAIVPVDAVPAAPEAAGEGGGDGTAGGAGEHARGTVPEIGGRRHGLDPTRYGDWELNGRCIDF
jgi:hypothetical protein